MDKIVDILVLNKDYDKFLEGALNSCLNQTYKNISEYFG
jgi:hypothetical protein